MNTFKIGDAVEVTDGEYEGCLGTVIEVYNGPVYEVEIPLVEGQMAVEKIGPERLAPAEQD